VATIQHSMWVPSPGLSLMMSSSLGDAMFDQGADYAVHVEDMLYGEMVVGAEELDDWVGFVQASFQRQIPPGMRPTTRPRRRRR